MTEPDPTPPLPQPIDVPPVVDPITETEDPQGPVIPPTPPANDPGVDPFG